MRTRPCASPGARRPAWWRADLAGPRASRPAHALPNRMSVRRAGLEARGPAGLNELHHVVGADEMAADHLDVRQHALQVLAGAHGVAEAALERRAVQNGGRARAAIAGDGGVGRLVHAVG